ncbi:hypothetical protein EC973_003208 [Apophysomyces ossiformis]|uniref:NDT80 domain-containing protein n=1 Tax=Apophysomyces ossiformis TaxID=679940 RepID=A0A8H7BJM6_9FUNG|nr:hypothetical protein EC973_003208 [Apophysomyces ossiformis]
MAISQPSTPRPDMATPVSPASPHGKLASSPDLIRRRPPLPARPASFTTTTFHSNPYPTGMPIRRRRTESSMFTFEAGPAFSPTKQLLDLWNMDQTNGYQVQLHVKMDRGFFRADQDWTCYRRNYFQVSSTFDIHGTNYLHHGPEVPCLVRTENQEIHQVEYFSIGVSARVANGDKRIELVQHTPKRDKGPQMIPEPRAVRAGGNLHLASVGSNHNIVTFERMQFKTATANNGKRRAAQQYYEIVVDLYCNTTSSKTFRVATTTSSPLVVRGRSPGHYADSHTRYRSMDAGTPSSFSPHGPAAVAAAAAAAAVPPPPPPPSMGAGDKYMPHPRFMSLPTSPVTDFGPYSPYQGYPYPMTYSPMVTGNRSDGQVVRGEGYAMHPQQPAPAPSQHPYQTISSTDSNDNSFSGRAEQSHGMYHPTQTSYGGGDVRPEIENAKQSYWSRETSSTDGSMRYPSNACMGAGYPYVRPPNDGPYPPQPPPTSATHVPSLGASSLDAGPSSSK